MRRCIPVGTALRSQQIWGRTLVLFVVTVVSVISLAGLARAFQHRARRRLVGKLELAINQHFAQLVRVRADAISFGIGGQLDSLEWQREIDRFLDAQVSLQLTPAERKRLEAERRNFALLVSERIAAGLAEVPVYQ
jgi:hypothetical protein